MPGDTAARSAPSPRKPRWWGRSYALRPTRPQCGVAAPYSSSSPAGSPAVPFGESLKELSHGPSFFTLCLFQSAAGAVALRGASVKVADRGFLHMSIADLDLGAFVLGRLFQTRDGVARQFEERLALALAPHDGLARVAADAHFRIERQLAQEVDIHLVRRTPAAAVAEHVDALRD